MPFYTLSTRTLPLVVTRKNWLPSVKGSTSLNNCQLHYEPSFCHTFLSNMYHVEMVDSIATALLSIYHGHVPQAQELILAHFISSGPSGLPQVFVGLHNPGRINCSQCNDGTLSWIDGETAYVNQYLDVSLIEKKGGQ